MKVSVLYRPNSEHARHVEEFLHEFQSRSPHKVEMVDVDSREGLAVAALYDIQAYPAILALTDEGELLNSWEGEIFPMINDLAAYA